MQLMKYEWRKSEKNIYIPKTEPELIEIPKYKYLMIKGKGNPNRDDFAQRVEVLYSLSYALRMMPKQGTTPEGYFEYTVYPLEGLWDLTEEGKESKIFNKDELIYTIMIRQPDFVNDAIYEKALMSTWRKKPNSLLDDVIIGNCQDGLSVQMMHVGSYDSEPESFSKMKAFIEANNLEIRTMVHREIYLTDARKTELEKQRTLLRYMVK